MAQHNALSEAQKQAAEIFATNDLHNLTVAQIAEKVGVSERTLYRWKQDAAFIAYQNDISEKVMEDFLAETYGLLRGIVRGSDSEKNKLKAIEIVLRNRGKFTDNHNVTATVEDTRSNDAIEQEIAALRRQLNTVEE